MIENSRTGAATRTRMRASEDKKAALLTERGWHCIPPGFKIYATSQEEGTCEVIGFHADGTPEFSRDGGAWRGMFDADQYTYTLKAK